MAFAFLQLALAMILTGSNVVVGKLLAQALPVPVVLLLRCIVASLALAPIAWRKAASPPDRRVLLNIAAQATVGTGAYNMLLLAGLRRTGALQAGLLLSALPAVVAVAAALLLRERLTARRWLAVLLAAAGTAALALGRGGPAAGTLLGNALVFSAVLAETGWILLSRLSAGRISVRQAAFWMQAFGVVLLIPLAGRDAIATLPVLLADARLVGLLLFHALTASVFSVMLWFRGMRRVSASVAGVFTMLLPATAAALAVVFLDERMTAPLAAGFVLMLGSILLATWPARRRRAVTAQA